MPSIVKAANEGSSVFPMPPCIISPRWRLRSSRRLQKPRFVWPESCSNLKVSQA